MFLLVAKGEENEGDVEEPSSSTLLLSEWWWLNFCFCYKVEKFTIRGWSQAKSILPLNCKIKAKPRSNKGWIEGRWFVLVYRGESSKRFCSACKSHFCLGQVNKFALISRRPELIGLNVWIKLSSFLIIISTPSPTLATSLALRYRVAKINYLLIKVCKFYPHPPVTKYKHKQQQAKLCRESWRK